MKIGDRIYVRGYVDEIRKDTVIVRNDGGYFGTTWNEVTPSAQPERKRGKWIDEGFYADGHGAHAFRCSECGGHIIEYDADPFCRWCGAYMRGEQDG